MLWPRLVAFLLAVAASAAVWILPLGQVSETRTFGNGPTVTRQYRTNVFQHRNGAVVVLVSFIPILLTLAPLAKRRLRVPAGILLLAFSLLGGGSIGLFYLPSAILLLLPLDS